LQMKTIATESTGRLIAKKQTRNRWEAEDAPRSEQKDLLSHPPQRHDEKDVVAGLCVQLVAVVVVFFFVVVVRRRRQWRR
jgi:hypothetical protein